MGFSMLPLVSGIGAYIYVAKYPLRGDTWLTLNLVATASIITYFKFFHGYGWPHCLFASTSLWLNHALAFTMSAIVYRLSPFHPLAKFPGPILNRITSLPLVLMVASGRRYHAMVEIHKRYGTFVRTGPNTVSINLHSAIGPIYASASAWNKSAAYSSGLLPGTGLFFIQDKESHNHRRRYYWAASFTNDVVASYSSIIFKRTELLLEALFESRNMVDGASNVSTALQQWSHDITGELTFGNGYFTNLLKDGDREGLVDTAILEAQVFEALGESPVLFHILWYMPMTKVFRTMDKFADRYIQRFRESPSDGTTLLSNWLEKKGTGATPLSADDLKQEGVLAIQAGSNGISTAATFAFFYLCLYPEIQQNIRQELRETFSTSQVTEEDLRTLQGLPYLTAVVEESFRLGAPLGSFYRLTPKGGAFVSNTFIPEGTIVGVPSWAQMISEENFYPDPLTFRPERWLPGGLGPDTRTNKAAIMTFSHGPFGCLGKPVAHLELRVVLAKVLLQYTVKFSSKFSPSEFLGGVSNMRVTTFKAPLLLHLH